MPLTTAALLSTPLLDESDVLRRLEQSQANEDSPRTDMSASHRPAHESKALKKKRSKRKASKAARKKSRSK